jgi:hypothetical protein
LRPGGIGGFAFLGQLRLNRNDLAGRDLVRQGHALNQAGDDVVLALDGSAVAET